MSRAIDLATKSGGALWRTEVGVAKVEFRFPELEAFYHAARAEMANEILLNCVPGGSICDPQQIADDIRAMADREGK